jgi:hypothetical protein
MGQTGAVAEITRWQDGPDTPDGVRARLRDGLPGPDPEYEHRIGQLLGRVDDGARAMTARR